MDDPRSGGLRRGAKIASFSLGMAGRTAAAIGRRAAGSPRETVNAELIERAAQEMFAVLGELKGGAMKFGQALSVMETAIPAELAVPFREALIKLQSQAPPLPARRIHSVLDGQLGTRWRERFKSFDDQPVAAASIGQVHKGIWSDGRVVAIKVQYPGVDGALRSDLKVMARMSGLIVKIAPSIDMQGFIDEYIQRTEAELNYRQEADCQRAFSRAFRNDSTFFVPAVLASSPKVIVSEWVEGTSISELINTDSQDERNLAAERLCEFVLAAPAKTQLVHGDPHPGNFLMLPDGRMAVIDFGAATPFSKEASTALWTMGELAFEGDDELLIEGLRKINFLSKTGSLDANELRKQLDLFTGPARTERFHVSRDWFSEAMAPYIGRVDRSTQVACVSPPRDFLMYARVFGGAFAISAQLDATVRYRSIMQRWLPYFAAE